MIGSFESQKLRFGFVSMGVELGGEEHSHSTFLSTLCEFSALTHWQEVSIVIPHLMTKRFVSYSVLLRRCSLRIKSIAKEHDSDLDVIFGPILCTID